MLLELAAQVINTPCSPARGHPKPLTRCVPIPCSPTPPQHRCSEANPNPNLNPNPNPNPNSNQVRIAALKRRADTKKITQAASNQAAAASNQAAAAGVLSPQSPPPSPPESPGGDESFRGKRPSRGKDGGSGFRSKEGKEAKEGKEGEEVEGESRHRHRKSRTSRDASKMSIPGESPVASRGASMIDNMLLPTASVTFDTDAKKDTSARTSVPDTSAHYQKQALALEAAAAPLQKMAAADPPLAPPPGIARRGSSSFLPAWNSKGYLWSHHDEDQDDDEPRSLRHDMVQLGVCKLDRLMLRSNGNMIFRDQHADIFSRWMYPIAYVSMMVFFYLNRPEGSAGSTTDNHAAGVPAYCSGRYAAVAGLE